MSSVEFRLSVGNVYKELLFLSVIVVFQVLCFTGFTIGSKVFDPKPMMAIIFVPNYFILFIRIKEYFIPKVKIMEDSIHFSTSRVFRKAEMSVLKDGDEVRVSIDANGKAIDIYWGDSIDNPPKSVRLELSSFSIEDRKTLKDIFSKIKEKGRLEIGDFR